MVSADSHRIPRAPCYWGPRPRSPPGSAYGAVTRCGPPSQGIRLPDRFNALRPAAAATGRTRPKQHRARNPRRVIARARFNHHPLPLATTHGISTPAGTEMFHFPASPPAPYDIQTRVTPHNGRRVPPFGNPRITARKPAPRGISQATASFIGPRCQGIHRTLIKTNNTQHNTTHGARATRTTPARAARRTKQENKQTGDQQHNSRYRGRPQMLASTMQFTTNPPTTPDPPKKDRRRPKGPGHQGAPPQNPTACHAPPHPRPRQAETPTGPRTRRKAGDQKGGRTPGPAPRRRTRAPSARGNNDPLRKEVIQPHLPVRLPCYDFVPITGPAFDRSPWGHGLRASPTFMT